MLGEIDDSFIGVVKYAIVKNTDLQESIIDKICNSIIELSGGDVVYIAKNSKSKLQSRNIEIKKLHCSGIDKHSIKNKFNLSIHQINRILRA